MRKNKFFMLGIITVFVAILSLTFVSSTFARYTSTVSGSDSARVAKWSFTYDGETSDADVIGNGQADTLYKVNFDLFNTIKDTDGVANDEDVKDTGTDGKTLIAPGTSGSFTFDLVNNSEVTAEYHIDFTETNGANIPLQYSLDKNVWYNSIEDLEAAYNEPDRATKPRLDDATSAAELHATLPMTEDDTLTVYWRWQYQSDGAGHPGHTDVSDTTLGINGDAVVTIDVTIRFDQVD